MSTSPRRWPVLCAVVLLLIGAVAPAVGGPGIAQDGGPPPAQEAVEADGALDDQDTARGRKAAALAMLAGLDLDRRSLRRQRERAVARLRGSLSTHRDGDRVRSRRAFREDRRALVAMARLARANRSAVADAASLVVSADQRTAATAVADAKRAYRRFGNKLDRVRDRRRVERSIERAERALDRGRAAQEEAARGSPHGTDRTRAVVRFETSWHRAQRVLDDLDRAATPVVTITARADPPWDAAGATRSIRGNVSAVRPYELDAPRLTVDGSAAGSARLDAPTAPARNASFEANVTLEGPVAEVVVSVREGDTQPPEREDWRDADRRGRGRSRSDDRGARRGRDGTAEERSRRRDHDRRRGDADGGHEESASAAVQFDGDGLPDRYEAAVVGTDPLDPDSDSSLTDNDEAGDGTPDGGEDFDGDRLVTYAEFDAGTDPFVADTDADGLHDRFELARPGLDPTSADTDGDGLADGAEDYDGDGLAAAAELDHGTSIASPDTDRDTLDDEAEARRLRTSPLAADTDGDGLDDAAELRLGTHPTEPDTDGDGVLDGDETFRSGRTDPGTGVAVAVDGTGDAARGVTIEPVAQPADVDVTAGPVVRVRNRTGFDRATVSLPVSPDVPASGYDALSVFTWSPGADRPWHAVPTARDAGNRTLTAEVTSFSYFAVVDERRWRSAMRTSVPATWPRYAGFETGDGWSLSGAAAVEAGRLVVAGGIDADVVVAADGSGDFVRIQPAVEAAGAGDVVLVREGSYGEAVVLDGDVRLVGENATLDGSTLVGDRTGIRVVGEADVTVAGLTIAGFYRGVAGPSTDADVRIDGVRFADTSTPVVATASSGDWHLTEVGATGTDGFAVAAADSKGDWTIEAAAFADGGVLADSATGDWTVTASRISGRYDGIDAWESAGSWTVRRTALSGDEDGLDANGATGSFRLVDVEAAGNDRGLVGFLTSGDWTVERADLSGNADYGIYSGYATGNWTVREADVSENGFTGISAEHTQGDWTLHEVVATDNDNTGIDAYQTAGDWRLSNVTASRNGRWTGVDAYGASGDWTLTAVELARNGRDGLAATASSGGWQIVGAVVRGNGNDGIDASEAAGDLSVSRSAIRGNGVVGVDGRGAVGPIVAAAIWWGQPGGPTARQARGSVVVESPCPTDACALEGVPVATPDGVATGVAPAGAPRTSGLFGAARARRDVPLPPGGTNVSVTVGLDRSAGPAELRLVTGAGPVSVVALPDSGNDTRVLTESLGRISDRALGVEVVADRGAMAAVDWIDVALDTDGDGLRDLVEGADLALPVGPVPGVPLEGLDWTDSDSDGDGVGDGAELTNVTLERPTDSGGDAYVVRPRAASSDPTSANSDGGGLNDSEERAIGSDPLVLETLVAGYALPTMTAGPNATVADGSPMTVAEASGLQIGGGRESDLVAWPSRQYFDPLFCIAELTAGPGCAPGWMRGVEVRDDRHYVYVPFVVYVQSDVELGDVAYEMSFGSRSTATPVKSVNETGELDAGSSRRGYVVYQLPDQFAGAEGQPGGFRSLGKLSLDVDLSSTIFNRPQSTSVARGYSVSTSTLLPRTEQMLEDTRFVLSKGLTVATAAESGYAVAVKTGSIARGALAFLYELALGEVDTPPRSASDVGKAVAEKGIASFADEVRETEGQIREDVFGNGSVNTVGPTVIRQN